MRFGVSNSPLLQYAYKGFKARARGLRSTPTVSYYIDLLRPGVAPVPSMDNPMQAPSAEDATPTAVAEETSIFARLWAFASSEKAVHAEQRIISQFVNLPYTLKRIAINMTQHATGAGSGGDAVGSTSTEYINTLDVSPVQGAKGLPIVFTHGMGSGLGMTYRNIQPIVEGTQRRMILMDWLGMGRSSRPPYPTRPSEVWASFWATEDDQRELEVLDGQVDFFLDSLEAWRKEMGLERFHLVGHSWGGYLSTLYAERYPERVESVMLVSPWGVPDHREFLRRSRAVAEAQHSNVMWLGRALTKLWEVNVTPHMLLTCLGPWARTAAKSVVQARMRQDGEVRDEEVDLMTDYLYYINTQRSSSEYSMHAFAKVVLGGEHRGVHARRPIENVLLQTQIPTMMMYGDRDWMYDDVAETISRVNERVSCHIVPGAGHHTYFNNPMTVNALIIENLHGKS